MPFYVDAYSQQHSCFDVFWNLIRVNAVLTTVMYTDSVCGLFSRVFMITLR